ncbi:hypothetical protein QJS66_17270 [Kocuria rhizophila]|nr:hypothetical protein QJS66_17270 [Kocuria rhizophila]
MVGLGDADGLATRSSRGARVAGGRLIAGRNRTRTAPAGRSGSGGEQRTGVPVGAPGVGR